MPDPAYFLSEGDRDLLQELLAWWRRQGGDVPGRPHVPEQVAQTPEVYIARAPAAGIPGLSQASGTSVSSHPGKADCKIWRIVPGTNVLRQVKNLTRRVWNVSGAFVPGDQFIVIAKDKFGSWMVIDQLPENQFDVEVSDVDVACDRGDVWVMRRKRLVHLGQQRNLFTPWVKDHKVGCLDCSCPTFGTGTVGHTGTGTGTGSGQGVGLPNSLLPGLYDTGEDNNHVTLNSSTCEDEQHWKRDGAVPKVPSNSVVPPAGQGHLPNDAGSRWCSKNCDFLQANGPQRATWSLEFTIPSSINPSTLSLGGRLCSDLWVVSARVNGVQVLGEGQINPTTVDALAAFYNFTLSGHFVRGTNRVEFECYNDQPAGADNYEGFRLEWLWANFGSGGGGGNDDDSFKKGCWVISVILDWDPTSQADLDLYYKSKRHPDDAPFLSGQSATYYGGTGIVGQHIGNLNHDANPACAAVPAPPEIIATVRGSPQLLCGNDVAFVNANRGFYYATWYAQRTNCQAQQTPSVKSFIIENVGQTILRATRYANSNGNVGPVTVAFVDILPGASVDVVAAGVHEIRSAGYNVGDASSYKDYDILRVESLT